MYTYNGLQFASLKEAADFIEKQLYVKLAIDNLNFNWDIYDIDNIARTNEYGDWFADDFYTDDAELDFDRIKYINGLIDDLLNQYKKDATVINQINFIDSFITTKDQALWITLESYPDVFDEDYVNEIKLYVNTGYLLSDTILKFDTSHNSYSYQIKDGVITEIIPQPIT